jgi:alpha-D-ribose 1-methylphosphonate 5-triphosphate diphosphatase
MIDNARVLTPSGWSEREETVAFADGVLLAPGERPPESSVLLDAGGHRVVPGIVDVHCEALEQNLAPRNTAVRDEPFALRVAEAQCLAWGVTTPVFTVCAAIEPCARNLSRCRRTMDLAHDARVHFRVELTAIDFLPDGLLDHPAVSLVCFNNHAANAVSGWDVERYLRYVRRVGRLDAGTEARLLRAAARTRDELYDAVHRVARAVRCPLGYHDVEGHELINFCRGQGVRFFEFPVDAGSAEYAAASGAELVMGAHNVVRGGSHNGQADAAELVRSGTCGILCSDYYLPSLFYAPFCLDRENILPLEASWRLVSRNPARLLGLETKGEIRSGADADLLIIAADAHPRILAVVCKGVVRQLSDVCLLRASSRRVRVP